MYTCQLLIVLKYRTFIYWEIQHNDGRRAAFLLAAQEYCIHVSRDVCVMYRTRQTGYTAINCIIALTNLVVCYCPCSEDTLQYNMSLRTSLQRNLSDFQIQRRLLGLTYSFNEFKFVYAKIKTNLVST